MDAALVVSKVLVGKLLECKRLYAELEGACDNLMSTLESLEQLGRERSKETRMDGSIQANLMRQLEQLRVDLLNITEERSTNAGKSKQFFGSCIGKGAKGHLRTLTRHHENLANMVQIVQAESSNVTASAVEEMAGGAAGKLIAHDGMRSFWREQFKNEFHLSWERFEQGLQTYRGALNGAFGSTLPQVLELLRYRLDLQRDGDVSVTEFARLLEGRDSASIEDDVDMGEVIQHHFQTTKKLLPSIAVYHQVSVATVAVYEDLVATVDEEGTVKVAQLLDDQIVEVAINFIAGRTPTSAIHFMRVGSKLFLLITADAICFGLDVWDNKVAFRLQAFANCTRCIASDGDYVFMSPFSAESRLVLVQRALQSDEGGNIRWETATKLVMGSLVTQICPLEDGVHLLTRTFDRGIDLWNFRSGAKLHHFDLNYAEGILLVKKASNAEALTRPAVVIYFTEKELVFEDIVNEPTKFTEHSLSKPYGTLNTLHADVGDTFGASYNSSTSSVQIAPRRISASGSTTESSLLRTIPLPSSISVRRLIISRTGTIILLCSKGGTDPMMLLLNPTNGNVRGVVGRRSWAAHTTVPHKPLVWINNAAQLFPIDHGVGGFFFSTKRAERIHIWDEATDLQLSINIRIAAPFSNSAIQQIAQDGDRVAVVLTNGMVLGYDFSGPYTDEDLVGVDATIAAELRLKVKRLESLQPSGIPGFLEQIIFLSRPTRIAIRRALKDLGLNRKQKHDDDDLAGLTKVLSELVGHYELKRADAKPFSPKSKGGVPDPRRFTIPSRWLKPVVIRTVVDGDTQCGCGSELQRSELIFQRCMKCLGSSFDRCNTCESPFTRPSSYPMCDHCYDRKSKKLQLTPAGMVAHNGALYLSVFTPENYTYYGPVATLLKLEMTTLRTIDSIEKFSTPTYNGLIVAPKCLVPEGIVLSASTYEHIAIFSGASTAPLKTSVLGMVKSEGVTSALATHVPSGAAESGGCYPEVLLYAATISGVVRCSVLRKSSAESAVETVSMRSFDGAGVAAMLATQNFLLLGDKTGVVHIRSTRTDEFLPIAQLQCSRQKRLFSCVQAGNSVQIASSDGVVTTLSVHLLQHLERLGASAQLGNSTQSLSDFGSVSGAGDDVNASEQVAVMSGANNGRRRVMDSSWQLLHDGLWGEFSVAALLERTGEVWARDTKMTPRRLLVESGVSPGGLPERLVLDGSSKQGACITRRIAANPSVTDEIDHSCMGAGTVISLTVGEALELTFPQLPSMLAPVPEQETADAAVVPDPQSTATDTPKDDPDDAFVPHWRTGALWLQLHVHSSFRASRIALQLSDKKRAAEVALPSTADADEVWIYVPREALTHDDTGVPLQLIGEPGGFGVFSVTPVKTEGFSVAQPTLHLVEKGC